MVSRRSRARVRTKGLTSSFLGGRLPSLTGRRNTLPKWVLSGPVVAVALVAAPGVLVLVSGCRVLLRRRPDRMIAAAVATVGLVVAALLFLLVGSYVPAWSAIIHGRASAGDVATVAAWSVLVGLPLGPAWWRLDTWWRERQPMGGPTERAAREQTEASRRRRVVHLVQKAARNPDSPSWVRRVASRRAVPDIDAGTGTLIGQQLAGDLRWPTGPRGALVLPDPPRVRHLVALGATGCGKSELVWLAVEGDLEKTGPRQVIHINCKQLVAGSSERLAKLAADAGRSSMRLVPGSSPWDPMRGTAQRVHQRLMAAEEWSEPWYQHLASVVLALALELAERETRSPESLADLVKDLLQGGLARIASGDPRAQMALETIEQKDDQGLVTRLMDQALQLAGWIGPAGVGGWSWEDAEVMGVDLPTGTDPGAAKMLLRLMLTDLEGWITEGRRPMIGPGRPVPLTLILEEISAFDDDPILSRRINNLMERARSASCRVILVGQGPSSLGDERTQEAILTNATVVTGRQATTRAVEALAGLAGTRVAEEGSVAYQPGSDTVAGSIRAQHAYAVDPNLLRRLEQGELVIIHQGAWAQVAVTMGTAGYEYEAMASAAPQLEAGPVRELPEEAER